MKQLAALLIGCMAIAACSDSPSQPNASTVLLSLSTQAPGAAPGATLRAVSFAASPPTVTGNAITFGADEIIIDRAEIVLREIELERIEATECANESEGDDDACEEFETGPILLELPLAGGTDVTLEVTVEPGTFDEIEFDIHKPEDDGEDADLEFLALHPDFKDVSIRVSGTWNDTPFVYESDLNAEQELALIPPITVAESEVRALTLFVDIGAWFVNPTNDGLVNPTTANKGGVNENLVRDNIEDSFEGFETDD